MTIDVLFQEFTELEQGDKKAFLKKALSYLLDNEVEGFSTEQLGEVKRRIEAFENGKIGSAPALEVEKKLEMKYGLSS